MVFSAPNSSRRTIAIIGAGFSGTATAAHLLRRLGGRPLNLVLIERGGRFGRGVAYANTPHPHLLNVPASRMSASPADSEEFLRYVRRRLPQARGEDFFTRALYGDYLQDLLEFEISESRSQVRVERVEKEAVDLKIDSSRATVSVMLDDGQSISAHDIVLATGAPPSQLPAGISCTASHPELRASPWSTGVLLDSKRHLFIIGTGLTMIDTAKAALDQYPDTTIHAISRHGLLPPRQTTFHPDRLGGDDRLLVTARGSTAKMMAAARVLASEAERRGGDWREVVTMLRHHTPFLWQSLSPRERSRFMRHVRPYWDIHRHRAPEQVLDMLEAARTRGQLQVHAGRLRSLESGNSGVLITWIPRGSSAAVSVQAAEVVNCSGPHYDVTHCADRLWRGLIAKGLAIPDPLKLGVRTGPHGALVDKSGLASVALHYIGPLLRADYWEATAVAELRKHADALAAHLCARCASIDDGSE